MAVTTYSLPATIRPLRSQVRSPMTVPTMSPSLLGPAGAVSHSPAGSFFTKVWPQPTSPASLWTASIMTGRGWLAPIRQAVTVPPHFLLRRRQHKIRIHLEEESMAPVGRIVRAESGSSEVLVWTWPVRAHRLFLAFSTICGFIQTLPVGGFLQVCLSPKVQPTASRRPKPISLRFRLQIISVPARRGRDGAASRGTTHQGIYGCSAAK